MDESAVKRLIDLPPAKVREALKSLAVSYCKHARSSRTFTFDGSKYNYFFHGYNMAWRNERAVEIPIAMGYLSALESDAVLEVGNVLSHYIPVGHDVVDKYEVADGVTNEDAVDFATSKRYDLIISVSTLEHIGAWGCAPDPGKVVLAVNNLVGLLSPGGKLVATVPLGLNPAFDRVLEAGDIPFTDVRALRRVRRNDWVETDFVSVMGAEYSRLRFKANALVVGLIHDGRTGVRDDT
jgi:SAM-dependent methyltransferase